MELASRAPTKPAHVLFGETRCHSFGPPSSRPDEETRRVGDDHDEDQKGDGEQPQLGVGPQPDEGDGGETGVEDPQPRKQAVPPQAQQHGQDGPDRQGQQPQADEADCRQHRRDASRTHVDGDDEIGLAAMHQASPLPAQEHRDDNDQGRERNRAGERAQSHDHAHGDARGEPRHEVAAEARTRIGRCAGAVSRLVVFAHASLSPLVPRVRRSNGRQRRRTGGRACGTRRSPAPADRDRSRARTHRGTRTRYRPTATGGSSTAAAPRWCG